MSELPIHDVPELLRPRPKDRRGYPIPYTTSIVDGKPDFRTINPDKVLECVHLNLCGLCGTPLGYWVAFIGGPKAVSNRAFADPAMHPDCARFAARTCPYLVFRDKPRAAKAPGSVPPPGHVDEKPAKFAIALCRGFSLIVEHPAPLIRARPFSHIDWLEFQERAS